MAFFEFPLNLLLALLWIAGIYSAYKHAGASKIVRFMLSPLSTVVSIALFAMFCLVIGLTGNREWIHSIPFISVYIFLMTVLLFVVLRGWRVNGVVRWRFILNHVGLLIVLSSAFFGAPDSETLRVQAFKDVPVQEAYRMDGKRVWMSHEIELKDFNVGYYENGTPSAYEAEVAVDGKNVLIKVNHPYSMGLSEDLYLSSYDPEAGEYCILQLVREPWKYPALAGILMMLSGAFLLFIQGPRKRK